MNRTLSYGAKLFAHLDPSKGVDAYRQQDGGHGSRNPLRSVDTAVENTHALKNVWDSDITSLSLYTLVVYDRRLEIHTS